MIKELNSHYSFTNPATVHDEEALTSLELAGRTAAKVNEVVRAQNTLAEQTLEHLENQDTTIEQRMNAQDEAITNIRTKTVPQDVKAEVQRQIENGTFDSQIDESLNHLNERVNNLLGSVGEGSTTMDAEVIDLRVDTDGVTHANAGESVRTQFEKVFRNISAPISKLATLCIPTAYQDNFIFTEENGVVTLEGTPDGSIPYGGFILHTYKNWGELAGKKLVVFVEELEEKARLSFKFCQESYNWSKNVTLGTVGTPQVCEFIIPESDILSGKVYLGFDVGNISTLTRLKVKLSAYIIEGEVSGSVLSGLSYFALNHPPVNYVPNAGFTGIEGKNPLVNVKNNSGDGWIEKNTIHVSTTVKTDSPFYTIVSVNVHDFIKNMKKLIINKKGDITNVCLTQTEGGWSKLIANLSEGENDLTSLNLSQYEYIYLTIGIYGRENSSGSVTPYFISDNEVIATSFIGQEDYPTREEVELMVQGGDPYITCWGDSLTAGGGWTTTLSELSGVPVHNGGTGGEGARTIMARQGGDVMMVNNVTIPAETTPVTLATYSDGGIPTAFGFKATPLLQGGAHVNPVSLGGVLGTLKWTGSSYSDTSGTWTFTRKEAGEEVVINRPTAMTTAFDREKNRPHLMIIFMGQNGGYNDLDELVREHKLMISHSQASHVVVLGLSSGTAESRANYETRMKEEFGRYFISLREYLSQYGLEDAGLTPTSADSSAMAQGQVPPQLLTDTVHYTSACKTVIGNMLYKKCCELNIF